MTTYRPTEFPKRCSTCRAVYDEARWRGLQLVGIQEDKPAPLELRNCPCRSTLAVAIEDERCDWCGWRLGADAPDGEREAFKGETLCKWCAKDAKTHAELCAGRPETHPEEDGSPCQCACHQGSP